MKLFSNLLTRTSPVDAAVTGCAPPAEDPPLRGAADPGPLTGVHLPALDGLRGLAVLVVMVCHFTFPMKYGGLYGFIVHQSLESGWVGVDLFFVLSGFLITGILYDGKGADGYFRNFYARRTLRIFPLYYGVLLAACVLLPLAAGLPVHREQAWLWLYGQNVYPLFHGGQSFHFPSELGLRFTHFWSLAVEEHFYLMWPVLVFLLSRRGLLRVSVVFIAGSLAARAACLAAGAPWEVLYKVTFLRMDGLAAGAWLALAVRGPGGIGTLVGPAKAVFAASGALLLFTFVHDKGMDRADPLTATVGYTAIAVFCASGLALVVALPEHPLVRGLQAWWLLWLGKYSYGLYVLHGLLRPWFERVAPIPARPMALDVRYVWAVAANLALSFSVSIAAAWLVYHLYEKHFLRLKRYFEPARRRKGVLVVPGARPTPELSCPARPAGVPA